MTVSQLLVITVAIAVGSLIQGAAGFGDRQAHDGFDEVVFLLGCAGERIVCGIGK